METFQGGEVDATSAPYTTKLAAKSEGDWQAYLLACRESDGNGVMGSAEMLAFKRACALAYLGKRAQNEGGVYSKTQVRILTPDFVTGLAKANTTQRFKRYPWLERLLTLLEEIDRVQDEISVKGNVLRFISTKTAIYSPILSGA